MLESSLCNASNGASTGWRCVCLLGSVFPNTIDVLDLEQRRWFSRALRNRLFPREKIGSLIEYRGAVLLLGGVRVEFHEETLPVYRLRNWWEYGLFRMTYEVRHLSSSLVS